MITLSVNGRTYSNWTAATIERSLENISGMFNLEIVSDYKIPFPIPRMSPCTIYINGYPVLTGYVDKIDITYDATSHRISVTGRDKTADVVDSKLGPKLEFVAPITLDDVIKKTLENIGISDIKVINKVEGLKPFEKGELISAEIGKPAFEYIEEYARKRQVILTTDGLGNIIITRASEESTNIRLINSVSAPFSTVKSASIEYDDSGRFNSYTFWSQGNPSGDKAASHDPKKATTRKAHYEDKEVRSSRVFNEIAESSTFEEKLKDRAKWEAEIRKAKAFKYSCVVVHHSPYGENGKPYEPNTQASVSDDFGNVFEELLIVGVEYRLDISGGSTTSLTLLPRKAFMLLEQDKIKDSAKEKTDKKSNYKVNFDNSVETFFREDYVKPK